MSGNYNDRDYERMARRRRTRRKGTASTVIAVAIIAAAAIVLAVVIIAVVNANKPAENNGAADVSATEQPTMYVPSGADTPTESVTVTVPTYNNTAQEPTEYYTPPTSSWQGEEATEAPNDNAEEVDPDGAATGENGVLHVYTTGYVTGDYYWTYDIDNVNVGITCKYDYSTGQYDFSITGVSPGVANIILYYKTDDTNKASTSVTVEVSGDLTVTQIG